MLDSGCGEVDVAPQGDDCIGVNATPSFPWRIDTGDPLDIAFWAVVLEVDSEAVARAVRRVGSDAHAVISFLRTRTSLT